MKKIFRVFTERTETFVIEIEAESKEEAEEIADSDETDSNEWKEVDGSLNWNLLVGSTEEIKKEGN